MIRVRWKPELKMQLKTALNLSLSYPWAYINYSELPFEKKYKNGNLWVILMVSTMRSS